MRVLITGGSGLLGGAIASELSSRGHECWGVSRRERPASPPFSRWLAWDLVAPNPPKLEGIDAVVHLAGEPVAEGRWTKSRKRNILESRTLGTNGLVDALAYLERRPKVLLAASAVGYYGDRGDELLDESAPPGSGFLAEVCVAWERESARAAELGMRVVQHRIGVVLAREGGAFPKMRRAFSLGVGGELGSGEQFFPWIHLDDVAGLFAFALENESVSGPLNTVAPHPVRNRELTEALAHMMNRASFMRAPAFALKLALGEMASAVLEGQRVSAQKATGLGYAFRFPLLGSALRDLTSSPD